MTWPGTARCGRWRASPARPTGGRARGSPRRAWPARRGSARRPGQTRAGGADGRAVAGRTTAAARPATRPTTTPTVRPTRVAARTGLRDGRGMATTLVDLDDDLAAGRRSRDERLANGGWPCRPLMEVEVSLFLRVRPRSPTRCLAALASQGPTGPGAPTPRAPPWREGSGRQSAPVALQRPSAPTDRAGRGSAPPLNIEQVDGDGFTVVRCRTVLRVTWRGSAPITIDDFQSIVDEATRRSPAPARGPVPAATSHRGA